VISLITPPAALTLALAVLAPYVYVSAVHPLGPFGGTVADCFDRRRVMVAVRDRVKKNPSCSYRAIVVSMSWVMRPTW
jgi:hypothetical protein